MTLTELSQNDKNQLATEIKAAFQVFLMTLADKLRVDNQPDFIQGRAGDYRQSIIHDALQDAEAAAIAYATGEELEPPFDEQEIPDDNEEPAPEGRDD